MKAMDLMADGLNCSLGMLLNAIADMSDAELMTRPVPGANHPLWQIGHLLVAENGMLGRMGGTPVELPAGLAERFAPSKAGSDNPADFVDRATLIELVTKVRSATADFARTCTADMLEKPTHLPFAPNVLEMLVLTSAHMAMHVGQIQVLRRKLGKPVLF